nr:hypothetical protein [Rhizobium sp. ACO-34A]
MITGSVSDRVSTTETLTVNGDAACVFFSSEHPINAVQTQDISRKTRPFGKCGIENPSQFNARRPTEWPAGFQRSGEFAQSGHDGMCRSVFAIVYESRMLRLLFSC